ERERRAEIELGKGPSAVRDERDLPPCQLPEREQRHPEDGAGGGPERLGRHGVGAALRQRYDRSEGVGGAHERSHVPGIPHPAHPEPKYQAVTWLRSGEVGAAEDGRDARWMRKVGGAGEELGQDVLARHEQVDGLHPGAPGRLDEVLALGDEQAELRPPAVVVQLADELEPLVVSRGDHPSHSTHWPWWPMRGTRGGPCAGRRPSSTSNLPSRPVSSPSRRHPGERRLGLLERALEPLEPLEPLARVGDAGLRLAQEALAQAPAQAACEDDWSAAFALCATAAKAAGSFTARSASTLRSSSISAFLQPATNWLYESPSRRAAALI